MNEALLAAALSTYCSLYNTKLFEVASVYGSLQKLYESPPRVQHNLGSDVWPLISRAWNKVKLQEIENDLEAHQIIPILYSDTKYPPLLRETIDRPYVLYLKGTLERFVDTVPLSCVGTRAMTVYGKRAIGSLIANLSGYRIGIISGLALGVDAEVHRTALQHDLPTLAVLAGGLDRYEPRSNHRLAEEIVAVDAIISEYPPGVRPQKHHFLERNRIIAGLSKATIVIEGKEHSGSLVTARYALTYGRDVGTVPGDIFSPNSQAAHRLLRDGAWPITSAEDILTMLDIEANRIESQAPHGPIHTLLYESAYSLDALHQKLGLPIPEIQSQLLELELKNIIAISSQGEYYLKA